MSLIWQVDFYRSPQKDAAGQILWDLLICDPHRNFKYIATCPEFQANSNWLTEQFKLAGREKLPELIQVFPSPEWPL